jgi:hypothetical protein
MIRSGVNSSLFSGICSIFDRCTTTRVGRLWAPFSYLAHVGSHFDGTLLLYDE